VALSRGKKKKKEKKRKRERKKKSEATLFVHDFNVRNSSFHIQIKWGRVIIQT